MHEIEELKEDRRKASLIRRRLIGSMRESMSEREPFTFDQRLKAFERAVVRIEKQFADRDELGRRIPAVLHADHHRRGVIFDELNDVQADHENLLQLKSTANAFEAITLGCVRVYLIEPSRFFDEFVEGHRIGQGDGRNIRAVAARVIVGDLSRHARHAGTRHFLEAGLDLTDVVKFQRKKTVVLKLFKPASLKRARASEIVDSGERWLDLRGAELDRR